MKRSLRSLDPTTRRSVCETVDPTTVAASQLPTSSMVAVASLIDDRLALHPASCRGAGFPGAGQRPRMPGLCWARVRDALRQTSVNFPLLRAGLTYRWRPGRLSGAEVRNPSHLDLPKRPKLALANLRIRVTFCRSQRAGYVRSAPHGGPDRIPSSYGWRPGWGQGEAGQ